MLFKMARRSGAARFGIINWHSIMLFGASHFIGIKSPVRLYFSPDGRSCGVYHTTFWEMLSQAFSTGNIFGTHRFFIGESLSVTVVYCDFSGLFYFCSLVPEATSQLRK